MVRVMLRQTGKIMNKSSAITNRLSIAMAGQIIDHLFSSDYPALLCAGLFTPPLGVTGKLGSVTLAFPGHLL